MRDVCIDVLGKKKSLLKYPLEPGTIIEKLPPQEVTKKLDELT